MARSVVRDRGVLLRKMERKRWGVFTKRQRKMKKDRGGMELGVERMTLRRLTTQTESD